MIKLFSVVFLLFMLFSCNNNIDKSVTDTQKLKIALKYAGTNSAELKKVVDYFSGPKDSMKLKAAYFLIENMIGKGYLRYKEVNNNGICHYNLFKRNIGIDSICNLKKKYEDSTHCGKIRFVDPIFKADIKSIGSDQIIENIEYAFKAWKLPWAKDLTFDEFKEYILPYRIAKEPLQRWRKDFFDNSNWIFKVMDSTTDRIKIASMINDSLRKNYRYIHAALTWFPGSLTLKQLYAAGGGRCDDLNMILGYWLRAVGIPVAYEFTPFWGNSNYGGHTWLSILDTTGEFVPMNAIYDNPIRDSLPFKGAHLAKAYRMKYELRPDFYKRQKYIGNFYDITSEYLPVINYTMKYNIPENTKVAIGVLNGIYWKPLVTKIVRKGDSIIFMNLARRVLYAPIAILSNDNVKTIGVPFFIYTNGQVHKFFENKKNLINVSFPVSSLVNNVYKKKCQVVYWNNSIQNWVPTGDTKVLLYDPKDTLNKKVGRTITFSNVVSNAIYRVINSEKIPNGISYGRPFIYNERLNKYSDY